MFIIFVNFAVCVFILPSTSTSPTNSDEIARSLNSEELVEKELAPIEQALEMIVDPETDNDKKLELKGEVRDTVKKIIERAVGAEREVEQFKFEKWCCSG